MMALFLMMLYFINLAIIQNFFLILLYKNFHAIVSIIKIFIKANLAKNLFFLHFLKGYDQSINKRMKESNLFYYNNYFHIYYFLQLNERFFKN